MTPRRVLRTALVAALLLSGCATRAPLPVADTIPVGDTVAPSPAPDAAVLARWREAARQAEQVRDWETAVSAHARVVAQRPDDLDALVGLAESYRRVGKLRESELTWRAARALDARDERVVLGHAAVLIRQGRARAALETLAPRVLAAGIAGTRVPGVRTYALAGAAYDRLGDHAAAERIYRRGLRSHPASVDLRNNLAFGLILQGRPHYAALILHDLEKTGRGGPRQRHNLALAWGLAGKSGRAAEVAARDLPASAVDANLAYYRWLRGLEPQQRRHALLRG